MKIFPFHDLTTADLVIDAVYEGGSVGTSADDPLAKLLGTGNMGGFRVRGKGEDKVFVALYTTGEDKDWPDFFDLNTGKFMYYGDNKTPGHELHDTPKHGNQILKHAFDLVHDSKSTRERVPPFFVFSKFPTAKSQRSIQFRGLAAPGFSNLSTTEDLVAVWKTTKGQRFQNYRATFTILNVPVVKRSWLQTLMLDKASVIDAPRAWLNWREKGKYEALTSEPTTVIRSVEEQTPTTNLQVELLATAYRHFERSPVAFEGFAARIFQMLDARVLVNEITRASMDGGRDAVGRYSLGLGIDPVYLEFSLEAKCYRPPINGWQPTTIGVKEVSRLISRIRHREFGVLVTTSVVARQAYQEVRDDRHPIIFVSGKDIAEILVTNGFNTESRVQDFLNAEFPV